ncbi:Polyketide biosynthesis protein PksE [Phycisphaerae bacterium RAS1]|nr:Polyketide biosynthesis protein PksE [Phycisphaerae bacterium RAS1]
MAHIGVAALGLRPRDEQTALLALAPALRPSQLGDASFRRDHGVDFSYICGEMANGIASVEMVLAAARAGFLGFFGAAGLALERIESAIDRVQAAVGSRSYGFNLIHSPAEPDVEAATVELYLRRGVRLVSASAYLDLTLPLVRYRVSGIHESADGRVVAPNRVMAKVSRVELARKFFSPPPPAMLAELVRRGDMTALQAELAATIPMAEDLTAEADSGGHTDNRPLVTLLPTMLALRDELAARFGYDRPLRVGAAGGIATPASAAAAFAMGAAYILTGSINQSCREAGTSDAVRRMLAAAGQADVMMAPAADMFEMGVNVQVLKRGTLFGVRARKLYALYRTYDSLDALPADERATLERDYFRTSLEAAWEQTRAYFERRDPSQIIRAEREPKHRMALVFRAYLGQSSKWANSGEPSRQADYQVWCGPAMAAFNEWARGSALEKPEGRDIVTVGLNLMIGAAALTRAAWLRAQGVELPPAAAQFAPRCLDELLEPGRIGACEGT